MSDNPSTGRPPQVTVAGWVSILGAVFLVIGLFDAVARLRSIEGREAIGKSLGRWPFDALGLDLAGAQTALHTVYVVAGGFAAAACIFGWFALQRQKAARIGLSVVAVPIFVSGFLTTSLFASLVAVSAVLLWSGPARDWFAGRPVRKPSYLTSATARPQAGPLLPPPPPPPPPPSQRASGDPSPYAGYAAPHPSTVYAPTGERPAGVRPVDARPTSLVAAAVITLVSTATVVLACVAAVLLVLADPDQARQAIQGDAQMRELGVSFEEVRIATIAGVVVFGLWSAVAAALAVLVLRGVVWARPALIASAVLAGLFSCLAAQFVFPVVTAVAGMVSAYLLLRPEVVRWFARR